MSEWGDGGFGCGMWDDFVMGLGFGRDESKEGRKGIDREEMEGSHVGFISLGVNSITHGMIG